MKNNLNDYMEHLIESYSIQENKSPWDQLNEAILSESAENHLDPNMSIEALLEDFGDYWYYKDKPERAKEDNITIKYNWDSSDKLSDLIFLGNGDIIDIIEPMGYSGAITSYGSEPYYGREPEDYDPGSADDYDAPTQEEIVDFYANELAKEFAKNNNISEEECLSNTTLMSAFKQLINEDGMLPRNDDDLQQDLFDYHADDSRYDFDGYESLNESDNQQNHLDPNMTADSFADDLDLYLSAETAKDLANKEKYPFKYIYPFGWTAETLPELHDYLFKTLGMEEVCKLTGHTGEVTEPGYRDEEGEYYPEFDMPDMEEVYSLYAEAEAKLFAKLNNIPEEECLNNKELLNFFLADTKYENKNLHYWLEDRMLEEMNDIYEANYCMKYDDDGPDDDDYDPYRVYGESLNESDDQQNHLDSDMIDEDFVNDWDNYLDGTSQYNWKLDDELSNIIANGNIIETIQYMGCTGEIISPGYAAKTYGDPYYCYPAEDPEYDVPLAEEVYDFYKKEIAKQFAKNNNISEEECLNNNELLDGIQQVLERDCFGILDDDKLLQEVVEYNDNLFVDEDEYYDRYGES